VNQLPIPNGLGHIIAPEWMTNSQILEADPYIRANANEVYQRNRDGTLFYQGKYMGIDWEVTTDAR
jgi:dTDP-4-dehydrorhamnose 3,5-epimerase-like enzyme